MWLNVATVVSLWLEIQRFINVTWWKGNDITMEKCPIDFYESCFYYPNLITIAPLELKIKRFVMWLWVNDITTTWRGVPNGTLSIMFTCCPNLMFLASPWLEIYRFSNWSFCFFEQFKVDVYFANFGQVKTDPIR